MQKSRHLLTALVFIVLAGAFVLFNAPTGAQTFTITIANCSLTSDKPLVVTEGDRVIFKLRSDVADEFHIHGYDLKRDVAPPTYSLLAFEAAAAGRYELELEKSCPHAGELIVLTKDGATPSPVATEHSHDDTPPTPTTATTEQTATSNATPHVHDNSHAH